MQRDMEERPREDRCRDWSEAATGQGMPGSKKLGDTRKDSPLEPLEVADTSILTF